MYTDYSMKKKLPGKLSILIYGQNSFHKTIIKGLVIIFVVSVIQVNAANMTIAEAVCSIDQIRSKTAGNISAYLIETTIKCGMKNANNISPHLSALGVPGTFETRSIMRQIKGPGIERYSIISIVGKTDVNGKFNPDNIIFNLGKIDSKNDKLAHLGVGHFLVKLDLHGNPVNTALIGRSDIQRISLLGVASSLTDYQKSFWKGYFDSIQVGLPTSGQGMDN